MPDGAYCIVIGKLGWISNQVVIVGGNCSITAIDSRGEEIFWTVASDRVTALAIFDYDGDGENEVRNKNDFTRIKNFKLYF